MGNNVSQVDTGTSDGQYPTLAFPPKGVTSPLCARCLTLLSHAITCFGDGTSYTSLDLPHSIFDPASTTCPICTKAKLLLRGAQAHISFEPSLRKARLGEWKLRWRVDCSNPKSYPHNSHLQFPHDAVQVCLSAKHKGGYSWGIGSFRLYPELYEHGGGSGTKHGDYEVITPLPVGEVEMDSAASRNPTTDAPETVQAPVTVEQASLESVRAWILECLSSHKECARVYANTQTAKSVAGRAWHPSRLVFFDHYKKTFRIVHSHYPPDAHVFMPVLEGQGSQSRGPSYLSLSHCWGPAPNLKAPGGGRLVLTTANVDDWCREVPFDSLAPTFQHALYLTILIGFRFIWIDSLCILQDSREDWLAESATMGDVYKHALFNIAALSAKSDSDGFLERSRNVHVEFGFRTPFATLLGRRAGEERTAEDYEHQSLTQECVLLRGSAKLCWTFEKQVTTSASNSPLFERGWVHQERCLAPRTLAFTDQGVFWACDESSRSEQPEWAAAEMERAGLRTYQLYAHTLGKQDETISLRKFHMCWHSVVQAYTLCNLTRQTDKLVAVGAVARELGSTPAPVGRYLAGLWENGLIEQLGWLCVKGFETPSRKMKDDPGYVAPSWSWASIAAPVQPRLPSNGQPKTQIALAEVRSVEVRTLTEYEFGAVTGGCLKLRGRLNAVTKLSKSTHRNSDGTSIPLLSLSDTDTGSSLWFSSDTVDGHKLSAKQISSIAWMPLTVHFAYNSIEGRCLVLQAVEDGAQTEHVQQPGERTKIYRRLGTGNFGGNIEKLAEIKLLLRLGAFTLTDWKEGQGQRVSGFKAREDDHEDFALI